MLARVAELERKGYTQKEIGEIVGVSQSQVFKYVHKIRDRYVEHAVTNREVLVENSVQQIRDVMKEAWQALDLSKGDEVTIVETQELENALHDLGMVDGDLDPNNGKAGGKVNGRRKSKSTMPTAAPSLDNSDDAANSCNADSDGSSTSPQKRRGRPKGKVLKGKALTTMEKVKKAAMIITRIVTTRKNRLPESQYLNLILNCIWKIAVLKGLVNRHDDKRHEQEKTDDFWSVLPGMVETVESNSVQRRLEYMAENMDAKGINSQDIIDADYEVKDEPDPEERPVKGGKLHRKPDDAGGED